MLQDIQDPTWLALKKKIVVFLNNTFTNTYIKQYSLKQTHVNGINYMIYESQHINQYQPSVFEDCNKTQK